MNNNIIDSGDEGFHPEYLKGWDEAIEHTEEYNSSIQLWAVFGMASAFFITYKIIIQLWYSF